VNEKVHGSARGLVGDVWLWLVVGAASIGDSSRDGAGPCEVAKGMGRGGDEETRRRGDEETRRRVFCFADEAGCGD
jgi:hypothetical protein